MLFAIGQANNLTEYHIDRCCEEGRCKKCEQALGDVGTDCPVWRLLARDCTTDVSDGLNFSGIRSGDL
jgi:hypothetical protein